MIWCNTHRRPADMCLSSGGRCGGIMVPCVRVDLTDLIELDPEYVSRVRAREGVTYGGGRSGGKTEMVRRWLGYEERDGD